LLSKTIGGEPGLLDSCGGAKPGKKIWKYHRPLRGHWRKRVLWKVVYGYSRKGGGPRIMMTRPTSL